MAHSLHHFLGSGETLGRLREHTQRLQLLQRRLEQLLPPQLTLTCAVANLKDGKLVILTSNGATAARLRQLLPTLQRQFSEQGSVVSRIEVRVRPSQAQPSPPARDPRGIGETGRASLLALCNRLPPGCELQIALAHLVARALPSAAVPRGADTAPGGTGVTDAPTP